MLRRTYHSPYLREKQRTNKSHSHRAPAGTISEDLLTADPTHAQASMEVVISSREMGDLLWDRGDRPGGLLRCRRATDIPGKLSAAEPENALVRGRYAEMLVIECQLSVARRSRKLERSP